MGVYKPHGEASGWWWAEVTVNGSVHHIPLSTQDRGEAEQREKAMVPTLRHAMRGLPQMDLGRFSVKGAATHYLWERALAKGAFRSRRARYSEQNCARAWKSEEGKLLKPLVRFFEYTPLRKITLDNVVKYQGGKLYEYETERSNCDTALARVKKETRRLYRLLRWAGLREQMYAIQDELGHWDYYRHFGWLYSRHGNTTEVYNPSKGWHDPWHTSTPNGNTKQAPNHQ